MTDQPWWKLPHPDEPDARLIERIARGETVALEALYARHGRALLTYLIGQVGEAHLAEEVLQDVMLVVWRGAAQFRGESAVTTWLLAIARRRAITARQRRAPVEQALDEQTASEDTGPVETLARRSEQSEVRAALRALPGDQRETLELIFYHGLTGPQAAEVLGVAPGTVKSRLHRAKIALERVLRLRENSDA
ncbi:MAG: sigma-70 family RNA polymerase sigma factor [Anaerolineae bacterium]|nr:sigma-70 family RNA polymerase sigma factor [Anaerolineae bacterium]